MVVRRLVLPGRSPGTGDAQLLRELLGGSLPAGPVSLAGCAELLAIPHAYFIAALDHDDHPIGFLVAYALPRFRGETMFLHEFDLKASFRGRQTAAAMIGLLIAECRLRQIGEIFVLAQASHARGFWPPHPQTEDEVRFVYEARAAQL